VEVRFHRSVDRFEDFLGHVLWVFDRSTPAMETLRKSATTVKKVLVEGLARPGCELDLLEHRVRFASMRLGGQFANPPKSVRSFLQEA